MKINKIYVGSWYPRTLFHLNEMYEFLKKGTSHLALDPEKIKSLKAEINPSEVLLQQDLGQSFLTAKFDIYDFESRENGLSLLSCKCLGNKKNLEEELSKMSDFAFKKVFSSFNYIYSLGAPIPKVFAALRSVMPFVFITEAASKKDVIDFLKKKNETIEKEFKNKSIEVYYGQNTVIINGDAALAEKVVKECIYYLHDAQNQFQKILDLHRFIWDEVSAIKSMKSIKYKDLANTRDLLIEIESDVVFFKSRIKQLKDILEVQKIRISNFTSKKDDSVWMGFADGFDSILSSGKYVERLWEMTNNYLTGASNLLSSVYQESSNKQINILQFVFIISAIASIMALGAIPGFSFSGTFNPITNILSGGAVSFSWTDLVNMGFVAVASGAFIFIVWTKLYSFFAGSKISDPELIAKSKFNKIKKMFN